jgi:hypothetical protein
LGAEWPSGDPARELFLQVLGDTIRQFDWVCYAYCLPG